MALFHGKVGLQRLRDGAEAVLRLSPRGALIVSQGGSTFQEAVRNGNCYVCETAVAGVDHGQSVATTHAFSLYNPVGSGVNLVVWRAAMGYVSGTIGAGLVNYVGPTAGNTTAVSGTAIVPVNCLLNKAGAGSALPKTTATVPANPLILRPFCGLGASLASTAVQPWVITDNVDGEFVVAPGGYLSLQGIAASGTTPRVLFSMTYEEVPII